MKTLNVFFLAFATLVVIVGLTFNSPALASFGMKSSQMCMNKMSNRQGMEMSDDMPMCGKMKMNHKAKTEAQEDEGEPTMESMGEHEMPGMMGQEKEQAGKEQKKEVKDPVCSMTVDPKTAEKAVYKGKTYYFCSKEDKEKFEKSPEKYMKQEKAKKRS